MAKSNLYRVSAALLALAVALLVAVLVGDSLDASPDCTPPPSNMVSWWPGDGNPNDIKGTNHGALNGGATFAPGKVGPAFSFDGTNDEVVVPNNSNLNVQTLTLDAWVYPTDISGEEVAVIVNKETASPFVI